MMKSISKYKHSFKTKNELSQLENIRDFVYFWAINTGFDEIESNKIILAVDEVCTNLIKYAFVNQESKYIFINIKIKNEGFIISISDDSEPFDLTKTPPIDMYSYFNNYQKGGLGIQIIKNVIDQIFYYPSGNNNPRNMLLLIKQIKKQ